MIESIFAYMSPFWIGVSSSMFVVLLVALYHQFQKKRTVIKKHEGRYQRLYREGPGGYAEITHIGDRTCKIRSESRFGPWLAEVTFSEGGASASGHFFYLGKQDTGKFDLIKIPEEDGFYVNGVPHVGNSFDYKMLRVS